MDKNSSANKNHRCARDGSTSPPKCPECSVKGIDKIVSSPSDDRIGVEKNVVLFYVVYCVACGYVYKVLKGRF